MSKKLMQPVGQKRLTNVAVVRLKKHGNRFEIACYKNKVLSWRSGVEKDLDEVLQSQTVYFNVSKGVLAKSKDLIAAFGTDDHPKICVEILEKGELQVAGKERESQFSSQFRDIATIVMQKTVNPETQRPYTISMLERLMKEIHFAVDPGSSSKKQALEVIRELQKHFPIKRAPMRLCLSVTKKNSYSLLQTLNQWNSSIVSIDETLSNSSIVCEMDPGFFRACDTATRELQGRLEILAVSVHFEGDTQVDDYEDYEEVSQEPRRLGDGADVDDLGKNVESKIVLGGADVEGKKGSKCGTCNEFVGDVKEYRLHFKSDWHKHNLKRKTTGLPPMTADEFSADVDAFDTRSDLKDYSF